MVSCKLEFIVIFQSLVCSTPIKTPKRQEVIRNRYELLTSMVSFENIFQNPQTIYFQFQNRFNEDDYEKLIDIELDIGVRFYRVQFNIEDKMHFKVYLQMYLY